MSNGRVVSRLSNSGKVLISVFVLLTNLSVKVATDPVVGGHHGGIIEKQTQLQQHQPTIGATHQQEDEPFLLNEIEEDVHCKQKIPFYHSAHLVMLRVSYACYPQKHFAL